MILLLLFAFLSGIVTILSPCIWPLLPIILASSISGKGHKRSIGITLGIIASFAIFTLAISAVVRIFHFDPNILRTVAVIIIGFLGLSQLIPALSKTIEVALSRLTNLLKTTAPSQNSGLTSGFLTGFSLGIVWSPCAGPILASIATLAATGKITSNVIFVTIAYVLGIGIPLFIFSYASQKIITKTRLVSKYTGTIQKIFGVVMILTALAIYTNYDIKIQTKLLGSSSVFNKLNVFENNSQVQKELNILKGNPALTSEQAPDFVGITKWLNTDSPISIYSLKGKVVLVDFWTYTCINCIRTLPHVTAWYDKYNDPSICSGSLRSSANNNLPAGLRNKCFVVIGIHTPEFEFEKNTENVQRAIKDFKINYPIGQDNDYATWNNFSNQYWPAEYLIDATGRIRKTSFGEGDYDKQEEAIQQLLKEAGSQVAVNLVSMPDETPKNRISPETYLGSKRIQFYYPSGSLDNGRQILKLENSPAINSFSLGGTWNISEEFAQGEKGATLNYNFDASKVFVILRPSANTPSKVKVLIDGKAPDGTNSGGDVENGEITVSTDRLYNVVDLKGKTENHILRLEFESPDIQIYTFTFG